MAWLCSAQDLYIHNYVDITNVVRILIINCIERVQWDHIQDT